MDTPHVLIVAHYDGLEPESVIEYPSWDAAYEGQRKWNEDARKEGRDTLGIFLCIRPLQRP